MPATKTAFSFEPALASTTPAFIAGQEADAMEQAILARIRERAYRIFEESGRVAGKDTENWARAESEILRTSLQVRESGSWISLSASLPTDFCQGIQIAVKPGRVAVCASRTRHLQSASPQDQEEIFLGANLAVQVEPSSAAASFRDGTLRLMIKKRRSDVSREGG